MALVGRPLHASFTLCAPLSHCVPLLPLPICGLLSLRVPLALFVSLCLCLAHCSPHRSSPVRPCGVGEAWGGVYWWWGGVVPRGGVTCIVLLAGLTCTWMGLSSSTTTVRAPLACLPHGPHVDTLAAQGGHVLATASCSRVGGFCGTVPAHPSPPIAPHRPSPFSLSSDCPPEKRTILPLCPPPAWSSWKVRTCAHP